MITVWRQILFIKPVSGLFESKQIMALPMTDWSRVIAVRMLLLSYEI